MRKFLKTVATQRCTANGPVAVATPAAVVADAEPSSWQVISARPTLNSQFFPDIKETADA